MFETIVVMAGAGLIKTAIILSAIFATILLRRSINEKIKK